MQQQNIPETKMLLTVPVPIAMNCMVYIINIPSYCQYSKTWTYRSKINIKFLRILQAEKKIGCSSLNSPLEYI